jgi:hypothetical protein
MKTLTFKPTDKIKFTTTDNFVDEFSTYLDSILKYWSENFKDKSLTVTKTSDKKIQITTDASNSDSLDKLYNTLLPSSKDKNIKMSQIINGYDVEWIAESKSKTQDKTKKTEPKKQEKSTTDSDETTDDATSILGGILDPIATAIAGGIKGVQKSHYVSDKKLMEQIQRIKELL